MKKILSNALILLLLLMPFTMKAQNAEITVVEYEWQEGDNLLTVWNKYGQKFKLKEYLEYNPTRSKYKSPQPGDIIRIAVHSDVKEKPLSSKFTNKIVQNMLGIKSDDVEKPELAEVDETEEQEVEDEKTDKKGKKSKAKNNDKTEPRIKLTWNQVYFSDTYDCFQYYATYKAYNMLGQNIPVEFCFYNENNKLLFKTRKISTVEKEKKTIYCSDNLELDRLPHTDGVNTYQIKAIAYSPFEEDVIMSEGEIKKFKITWKGDLAQKFNPETDNEPGLFESILNLAVDVASAVPGAKEKHEKTIAESPWLRTDAEKAAAAKAEESAGTRASSSRTSGTFKGDFAPYYSYGSNFKVITPEEVASMSEDQRLQLEKVLQDAIADCGGQIFKLDDERRKLREQKRSATAKAVDASIAARRNHNAQARANKALKQANVQAGHTSVGTQQIDRELEALFKRKDALTANLFTVQNRSGEAFTSAKDEHEAGARRILNAQQGIKVSQDNYRANERLYNSYADIVDKMNNGLIDYNERDYKNAKEQMKKIRNDNNSKEGYTKIPKNNLEE